MQPRLEPRDVPNMYVVERSPTRNSSRLINCSNTVQQNNCDRCFGNYFDGTKQKVSPNFCIHDIIFPQIFKVTDFLRIFSRHQVARASSTLGLRCSVTLPKGTCAQGKRQTLDQNKQNWMRMGKSKRECHLVCTTKVMNQSQNGCCLSLLLFTSVSSG